MNKRKFLCLSIYALFLTSCAKQGVPSGGPKDSIPPKLISSNPKQHQLNFKEKEIQLTFSETVFVNNPKEQIIITPSVGKDFDATAKNKVVTFKFQNDLKDSTTYTLSFRDAIKDITEKNTAPNLTLAFSTGPYIDSLSIAGTVLELLKDKTVKDATVALYQNSDTFNIFKNKPIYQTKTNDKGLFKIENLKHGIYYIYAFEDKNRNLLVDSKNESYGFRSEKIQLEKNVNQLTTPLVRLDARPLKLTNAKPYNNYYNIKTSKSMTGYSITADPDTTAFISCYGDDQSSVRIYNTFSQNTDSLKIHFQATDSIDTKLDSVLYVKFSKREVKPEKFIMKTENTTVEANTGLLRTRISFNKPISKIDFDSLFFQPDSTTIINFKDQDLTWDFNKNIVTIQKKFDKTFFAKEQPDKQKPATPKKENKERQAPLIKNDFIIANSAFISIDNDSSKYAKQTLKILRDQDTGIIRISIKTSEKNYLCQLLSSEFKVINTIQNKPEITFQNLPPASYIIRFIADKNANGRWDPGNFHMKNEPEPIKLFKNTKNNDPAISLKANWEIGPLLITYP